MPKHALKARAAGGSDHAGYVAQAAEHYAEQMGRYLDTDLEEWTFEQFLNASRMLAYGPAFDRRGNYHQHEWISPAGVDPHTIDFLKGQPSVRSAAGLYEIAEDSDGDGDEVAQRDRLASLYEDGRTLAPHADEFGRLIRAAERRRAKGKRARELSARTVRVVMLRPANAMALACACLVSELRRIEEGGEHRLGPAPLLRQVERTRGRGRLMAVLSAAVERSLAKTAKDIYEEDAPPAEWKEARRAVRALFRYFHAVLDGVQGELVARGAAPWTQRFRPRPELPRADRNHRLFGDHAVMLELQNIIQEVFQGVRPCSWDTLKGFTQLLPVAPPHIEEQMLRGRFVAGIEALERAFEGFFDGAKEAFGANLGGVLPEAQEDLGLIRDFLAREVCAMAEEAEILWKTYTEVNYTAGGLEVLEVLQAAALAWKDRVDGTLERAFRGAEGGVKHDAVLRLSGSLGNFHINSSGILEFFHQLADAVISGCVQLRRLLPSFSGGEVH